MAAYDMPDQFEDAEGSIDKQRLSALEALANFGRHGLEQALAAKASSGAATSDASAAAAATARMVGGDESFANEQAGVAQSSLSPYGAAADETFGLLNREGEALRQTQDTYFRQAGEAVPLYRKEAENIVAQYRHAAEEKLRQRQHEIEMMQLQKEAALATLAAAQSSGGGGGGGGYGPIALPVPEPPAPPNPIVVAATAAIKWWTDQSHASNLPTRMIANAALKSIQAQIESVGGIENLDPEYIKSILPKPPTAIAKVF